ncbi:MAG: FAD synthetase family protein, partial [Oscillospiraceae bacterium]
MQVIDSLPAKFDFPTAIAVGYFDGVHKAHSEVIKKAVSYKKQGLTPVVFSFKTINSAPTKKKGSLLLQTFSLKCQRIEALGGEVFLCPPFSSFMSMTKEEFALGLLAKELNAGAVCCGYDYHFGKGAVGNPTDLKSLLSPLGIKVDTVDAIMCGDTPVSSTLIRELLQKGEIDTANVLLGY